MNRKPNIIYILQDHQAFYGHGMYEGGVKPKRPCFEAFAKEGIEFENARCVSPMCGPARRSMLTALYPHSHGQIHNENDPPYNDEVILDSLADSGYDSYYYGKWHAGPGAASDHKTKGYSYTSYGNPYLTEEYRNYLQRKGLPPAEHYIEHAFMADQYYAKNYFPKLKEGSLYKCETDWCGEHATGITVTPKETHEAFFLASLACDKLEELAAESSDKPFSMQIHFWGPHQPFFPTREFADLYNPEDIGEYPSFRDNLEKQPYVFKMEASHPMTENGRTIKIPSVFPWSEWQKILARCYGHITMIDSAGGMIVDKLKELGLDENTLIIWTTDHGDAIASHGGHFDKDSHMSEEVMRVPLAINWKGIIPPETKDNHLVFTLDIPATMMDAAGLKFRKGCEGRSLMDLVKDRDDWRDSLMCESYGHGYGVTIISRMIIKGDYKYVITENDLEQLYNLKKDPFELDNLAVTPEFHGKIIELREELRKRQKENNDPIELDYLISTVKKWKAK